MHFIEEAIESPDFMTVSFVFVVAVSMAVLTVTSPEAPWDGDLPWTLVRLLFAILCVVGVAGVWWTVITAL